MLDINEIKKLIPHRYPFLLVDRIIDFDKTSGVGIKNVSANEEFFNGHFEKNPIMPGVLIIEALAQVGCVVILSNEEFRGKLVLFAAIDNARFKKQVIPGDQLKLHVTMTKIKSRFGVGECVAYVDDEVVCSATLKFMFDL